MNAIRHRVWRVFGLTVAATGMPDAAHANAIWPALLLAPHLLSLPVIVFGLLIEIAVLKFYFAMNWGSAVKAGIVANTVSSALGLFLFPIAGILWEFFPGILLYQWFDFGTFSPLTFGANYVMAVLIAAGLEFFILRRFFGLASGRKSFLVWVAANCASVALAFASLIY